MHKLLDHLPRELCINYEQSDKPNISGPLTQEALDRAFQAKQRQSSLERTLIDATVRPGYAGGVGRVLEAYRRARARLSVPGLANILRKLGHVYPYHQAIGFYMERAGFPSKDLSYFKELGMNSNFYLAHNVGNPVFNREWRIHHPQGL
jgi:hypothetical protein